MRPLAREGRAGRTIVAPIDGDPYAGAAARVAARLATDNRTTLIRLSAAAQPSAVARTADTFETTLIVMGMPDIGTVDRTAQVTRACSIASSSRHPLLTVPTSALWPPRTCVVGMDFGRASIAAAMVAAELLDVPARQIIALVDTQADDGASADPASIPPHLRLLFESIPTVIPERRGVTRTFELLHGLPVEALLGCVRVHHAGVLGVGLDSTSRFSWRLNALPGPIVRGLLTQAPCAVLLSPAA